MWRPYKEEVVRRDATAWGGEEEEEVDEEERGGHCSAGEIDDTNFPTATIVCELPFLIYFSVYDSSDVWALKLSHWLDHHFVPPQRLTDSENRMCVCVFLNAFRTSCFQLKSQQKLLLVLVSIPVFLIQLISCDALSFTFSLEPTGFSRPGHSFYVSERWVDSIVYGHIILGCADVLGVEWIVRVHFGWLCGREEVTGSKTNCKTEGPQTFSSKGRHTENFNVARATCFTAHLFCKLKPVHRCNQRYAARSIFRKD